MLSYPARTSPLRGPLSWPFTAARGLGRLDPTERLPLRRGLGVNLDDGATRLLHAVHADGPTLDHPDLSHD